MPTYHTKHIDPTGRQTIRPVEGRKFKVAIGGGEFWFFVHDAYDAPGTVRISDVRAGLRVIDVPHIYLSAARGDKTIAAKRRINDGSKTATRQASAVSSRPPPNSRKELHHEDSIPTHN